MISSDPSLLLDLARDGDRRALGRLLSVVERGGQAGRAAAAAVFAAPRQAWVVGLAGAPGAGKSTLVDHLVSCARQGGERVAVLAVDPSSPVSGGAVLGDRVRLAAHVGDPSVFVRSMASRGARGGLASAAFDAVRVFAAAGWPWVLLEAVGTGQADVDVGIAADTVVAVVTPDWGDEVQAEKAGLLEVADVLVVNKADRPGADRVRSHLAEMLALMPGAGDWPPPVVVTAANAGHGVDELWDAVGRHRAWLTAGGDRLAGHRRDRLVAELRRVVELRAGADGLRRCEGPALERAVEAMSSGVLDPAAAAELAVGPAARRGGASPRAAARHGVGRLRPR